MEKRFLLTLLVALVIGATGMRAATNYGINIAGVEVSSSNYNNVTGSKITGSVKYDPTNKILTLTNATISREDGGDDYGIHNRSVDDLTIKIVGTCTVQCAKANALHLDKHTSINITSGSTLNAKMTAGENSGRGVIYVNDVTVYLTGPGTLYLTGTGKTSSYTIAGIEGKSKTGSSNVTLTNIKANILTSGHCFNKCKSVTFGTQSDVKMYYSNGKAIYETGAMYCNGTVKCVTPSEGTSFNTSSGYFVGGSSYSHFTDDWGLLVNSSNFPNSAFRNYMLTRCSSGEQYLTKSQHQGLTSIDCSNHSISDLTGINLLTYLTSLNCSSNSLTSLPTLPSSLQTIDCSSNRLSGSLSITSRSSLKSLNVSYNTGLTTLNCYSNALTTLNVNGCSSLTTLNCGSNQLTSLGNLPSSLQTIDCSSNRLSGTLSVTGRSALKTLNVSGNTGLTTLNCYNNALTTLDMTSCSSLTTLDCHSNQLTSFQVLSSLQTINCSSNRLSGTHSVTGHSALKSLDVSGNTGLTTLNCYSNALTTLNVNGCSSLTTLNCYSNQLTSLGTLPSSLTTLNCGSNQLTTLDVSFCKSLTKLDCNSNQLTSLGNLPSSLTTLYCYNNRLSGTLSVTGGVLKTLVVSNNTGLTKLYCYDNLLTSLDVSGCSALTELHCGGNQLTSLGTLPNSLQTIDCFSNRLSGSLSITGRSALKKLDVSLNTDLTTLNCYNNALTSLDVSGCSSLTTLDCHSNQLTSFRGDLPSSLQTIDCSSNRLSGTLSVTYRSTLKTLVVSNNTGLTKLYCYDNLLTSLDVSGCSALTELHCGGNQLTSLGTLPNSLQTIDCFSNRLSGSLSITGRSALKKLDVSLNTDLTTLNCQGNALTSLDVSGCSSLTSLNCMNNALTTLNYSGCTALKELICTNNQLTSLGALPNSLISLTCVNNQLTELPTLPSGLKRLYCGQNQLTTLPTLPSGLNKLVCWYNQLTALDVTGCPNLVELECYHNQLTQLNVASTALVLINASWNHLTELSLTGCSALTQLDISENYIAGANMTALIASLRTKSPTEGYFHVIENRPVSQPDANTINATQIAAARAKGWIPMELTNNGWVEIESDGLLGDINADGEVDVDDVNFCIYIILGKKSAADYPGNADVDDSGEVDVDDVNIIINIILGKIQTLTSR